MAAIGKGHLMCDRYKHQYFAERVRFQHFQIDECGASKGPQECQCQLQCRQGSSGF